MYPCVVLISKDGSMYQAVGTTAPQDNFYGTIFNKILFCFQKFQMSAQIYSFIVIL